MPDQGNVAVFWDYENCAPPLRSQGYAIVDAIRRIAHIFGRVTAFKTYLDMSAQPRHSKAINFRSELQSSGVSMIDCPHNRRKDVVDKMILVDMLAFAIDHRSPATVILVAGDRDYAYAMSTLRLRQYTVVLIVPSAHVTESLVSQASVVIDWNYAILKNRSNINTPPVRQPHRDLDEDILERLVREIQDSNEDPAVTPISSSRHTATATAHTHVAQPASTGMPKKATGMIPETLGHHRVRSAASRARSNTQSTHAVPDIDQGSVSPSTVDDTLSDGGVAGDLVSTANEIQDASYDPFARPPIMSPRLGCHREIVEPGSPPTVNFSPSPSPSATFNLNPTNSRTISGGTPISYGNPSPQRTVPAATSTSPAPTDRRSNTTSALKSTDSGPISAIMDDSILPSDRAAVMDALGLDDDDNCGNDEIATNVSTNSPRLTEVDNDPSRIHVMNAVSSRFDHDIARYPPANDTSPPITEPSGIPLSQQSSLALSAPDLNITTPNAGIGSPPQAMPSVISDNSRNDSSGYQSLSMGPVEDRIRRLTPPQFLPLIDQLLLARSKGIIKPGMSTIAIALIREGVTTFWEYVAQAEQASLVELGGWEGGSWISLHPDLFKEETTLKSLTSPPARRSSFPSPQYTVNPSTLSTAPLPHATTTNSKSLPLLPVVDPLCFQPLIACLSDVHRVGMSQALRLTVDVILGPAVYSRAGVGSMKEYLALAVDAGIAEVGGADGHWQAWVRLHPDVLSGKRTFYVA